MNRHQRRSKPSGGAPASYAALAAEHARLRRELAEVREQLAEWRGVLLDNDLIAPTPREELGGTVDLYGWPPLKLQAGRWVGGCEHVWADLLCHGLTDAEVDELRALVCAVGLAHGGDLSEITSETDPRCAGCRATPAAVSGGDR